MPKELTSNNRRGKCGVGGWGAGRLARLGAAPRAGLSDSACCLDSEHNCVSCGLFLAWERGEHGGEKRPKLPAPLTGPFLYFTPFANSAPLERE